MDRESKRVEKIEIDRVRERERIRDRRRKIRKESGGVRENQDREIETENDIHREKVRG